MTCLLETEVPVNWDFDYTRLYECCTGAVLDAEMCPYEACVSLLVTDDEGIRQINLDTRDIDAATDVLSFPSLELSSPSDFSTVFNTPGAFHPETGELLLGDIVVSSDRIRQQADEYCHDIQREFAFLIVHSMLHLCGYDHIKEDDRLLMEERQKIIMESLYGDFPKLQVK